MPGRGSLACRGRRFPAGCFFLGRRYAEAAWIEAFLCPDGHMEMGDEVGPVRRRDPAAGYLVERGDDYGVIGAF